jgi:hypothetical protein
MNPSASVDGPVESGDEWGNHLTSLFSPETHCVVLPENVSGYGIVNHVLHCGGRNLNVGWDC